MRVTPWTAPPRVRDGIGPCKPLARKCLISQRQAADRNRQFHWSRARIWDSLSSPPVLDGGWFCVDPAKLLRSSPARIQSASVGQLSGERGPGGVRDHHDADARLFLCSLCNRSKLPASSSYQDQPRLLVGAREYWSGSMCERCNPRP
jgi:hypothetical protein